MSSERILNISDFSPLTPKFRLQASTARAMAPSSVMEKLISTTEDVYYFDVEELNEKLIKYLNTLNDKVLNDINFYNNVYPKVIISKNGKIIDFYELKCNGFNCTNYYKNEF